jgi:hypothetical protein
VGVILGAPEGIDVNEEPSEDRKVRIWFWYFRSSNV